MNLHPNDRTAVFVDGPNLNRSAQSIGLHIDFNALLRGFATGSRLIGAHYFTCTRSGPEGEPLLKFLGYLSRSGWRVITKPATEVMDEATGLPRIRDRIDVDLAVALVTQAPRLDHVVLFSGDADYVAAVHAAQDAGARVTVCSTMGKQGSGRTVAGDLLDAADGFVDLVDLAPDIERRSAA